MKPAGRAGWLVQQQQPKKKNPFKNFDVCVTETSTIYLFFSAQLSFSFADEIVILLYPFSNGDEGSVGRKMTGKSWS
jgi:hypothetical protein